MIKKLYTLLVALFFIGVAMGQPCLPDGIIFRTQNEIDSFPIKYPNCTEIQGNVLIEENVIGNITNLNGLSVLTSVGGYLDIFYNEALTSLTGLDNVTSVGGYLVISYNNALSSLAGLDNVTSVGGGLVIGSGQIGGNGSLTSLMGLANVTFVGGDLLIEFNNALSSLAGLENVTSVGGHLNIWNNDALISLTGLDNVISVGGPLWIIRNDSLSSLSGLDNVTSVGGELRIGGNDALNSLAGLDNVTSVGTLSIWGNDALTSLTGLDNVTAVGGNLEISNNDALSSLSGLDNVTSIGYSLYITQNSSLTSLTGLDNIDANTIDDLYINSNDSLTICEVQSICDYLAAPNGSIGIHDNAPGCNSQEEVEDACETVSIEEQSKLNDATIFPNPSSTQVTIELPTQPSKNTSLTISNTNGQELITQSIIEPQTEIDLSSLPSGIYIVKVWNDKEVMVRNVIKQ